MNITGRRLIQSENRLPRGYGIAYRAIDGDYSVCYPVPIHWLVRLFFHLWAWIRFPSISALERISYSTRQDIYSRGIVFGQQKTLYRIQKIIEEQLDPKLWTILNSLYQNEYQDKHNAIKNTKTSKIHENVQHTKGQESCQGKVSATEGS